MTQPTELAQAPASERRARYLEPSKPLVFPESAEVPETQLHLDLRTLLYLLLSDHLGPSHTVGSDQFVYYDASDPRRCLAPDVYVKCVPRGEPVRSWKTWERGAPDVAVEIVSDSDSQAGDWNVNLEQYQALGVRELLRLDLLTDTQPRLRVWDRVDEALRERLVENETAVSLVLNVVWKVAPAQPWGVALRISTHEQPEILLPTAQEARQAEAAARQAAEARVAELEALLRERQ